MATLLLAAAIAEIMPPKRVFNWKRLFRFKRRWFNNFRWRPSSQTKSMPRRDINVNRAASENPNQDSINQITRSVGGLSNNLEHDPIIPVMILDVGNGSYRLLFPSNTVAWSKDESKSVKLPNNHVVELSHCAKRETQFTIDGEHVAFATISIKPSLPYQPIEFGQDVQRNQLLYLFDFRYDTPWVEPGTVAFVDGTHFIFDSEVHSRFMEGALVFYEAGRLVGVVYGHVGSNKAIQISYLRKKLKTLIPESIGHGGGAGPSSSSGGSSSRIS